MLYARKSPLLPCKTMATRTGPRLSSIKFKEYALIVSQHADDRIRYFYDVTLKWERPIGMSFHVLDLGGDQEDTASIWLDVNFQMAMLSLVEKEGQYRVDCLIGDARKVKGSFNVHSSLVLLGCLFSWHSSPCIPSCCL